MSVRLRRKYNPVKLLPFKARIRLGLVREIGRPLFKEDNDTGCGLKQGDRIQ